MSEKQDQIGEPLADCGDDQSDENIIKFKAMIGDNVFVLALRMIATINQICVGYRGVQYEISYFDDSGHRATCWLFAHEFKPQAPIAENNP